MSLINKMLNDLEKRDAFLKENHDQVLDGLYSAYDLELTNKKKANNAIVFLICLICTVVILVCAFVYIENLNSKLANNNDINIEKKSDLVQIVTKTNIVPVNNDEVSAIKRAVKLDYPSLRLDEQLVIKNDPEFSSDTKINHIDSIQFEKDSFSINLLIKMPDEIDYLVYGLSNPNRTVIEVENVELGFRLEDLQPIDPIVAIRYSINDERRFKLVLESTVPLTIKKSISSESATDYNLVVMMEYDWQKNETIPREDLELAAIVEQQVALENENVFKGDIIKTPVSRNSDAYAEKLFQQAYIQYKQGSISESLKKLNMSLNQDAGHTKARSTLALILSEKDHYDLAYSVLNEGLIQFPDNVEWIKMYARLLLNEDKLVDARSMLAKQQPALALNTEYYALQAAVLQKLGEFEEAARIYRNLLHVNPHKGIWWMGLGISLESLKRYDDALYAYQKASGNASIVKDTRQFLMQRINRLSNILEDEST
ncbi:MAG: tetratricopeptide repeat protein [Proteobacteria bacterium]|nr:AMIN domain-containing protein [Pseudomonadota bacterium]NOG60207.1 tetratricopeptide repeat protein [Pseudomonadota bacterium]